MAASYLIALLFAAAASANPAFLRFKPKATKLPIIPGTALICACLCALFAAKLHIVNDAAHHFSHLEPYAKTLPILVIQSCDRLVINGCNRYNSVDAERATCVELFCIAQSSLLFVLASLLHGNPIHRRVTNGILAIAAITSAILALFSSAIEGPDLYAYIAQAQATPSAYNPNATPFKEDFAVLNHLWGLPLWPSPYGPLWIALTKVIISFSPTLIGKLITLRFFQILVVGLCAVLIATLRLPYWVQATFIVNPMVYDTYVSEGHNDLFGAALVLAAAAVFRRLPFLALLATAAAGIVKVPYLLIGMLAFTTEKLAARRITFALISIITACIISIFAGGKSYWTALRQIADASTHPATLFEALLHLTSVLCALALLGFALFKRKFITGAIWLIPSLGTGMLAQYLAWSFPYALLAEEPNLVFFATLPITMHLLNTQYEITPLFIFIRIGLVVIPTIVILRALLLDRYDLKR